MTIVSGSESSIVPWEFASLSDSQVLTIWVDAMDELRRRQIVRSANNPTGDYAEGLVAKSLGLTLERNSAAGFDGRGPDGTRYQIKARRLTGQSGRRQLGVMRNLDQNPFDVLIAVMFGPWFDVLEVWQFPIAVVREYAKYVPHVNGHRLHVRGAVLEDPRTSRLS